MSDSDTFGAGFLEVKCFIRRIRLFELTDNNVWVQLSTIQTAAVTSSCRVLVTCSQISTLPVGPPILQLMFNHCQIFYERAFVGKIVCAVCFSKGANK